MSETLIFIIATIVVLIIMAGIAVVFHRITLTSNGKIKVIGLSMAILMVTVLLLYVWFPSPFRKVTGDQINKYISESIDIEDSLTGNTQVNEKLGKHNKTMVIGYRDSFKLPYYEYVFYSKRQNKFFNLLSFEGESVFDRVDSVKSIVMTVNKNLFNDTSYGTIDNPVPVLRFMGKNVSIRYENKDFNKAYMNVRYVRNVRTYLEDFLPEKDFNRIIKNK